GRAVCFMKRKLAAPMTCRRIAAQKVLDSLSCRSQLRHPFITRPQNGPGAGGRQQVFFSIIPEKCVSCLACARVCPVEAVAVDGSTVRIVDESCIRCGVCVPACPHDAIEASGDLEKALACAAEGDAALILSVEAGVHFFPLMPEQVVNAAYQAGFRTVHRGVLGDELVAAEYQRLLGDHDWGTMLRSTCPIVIERVQDD